MTTVPQQHHLAVDAHTLREALDAHQRYLAGRSGGRRLNLTYADLANTSLEGVDLRDADLSGADLGGADLTGASMKRAVLNGVNLSQARLDDADMTDVLRAPPPIFYVDDRSLTEVVAEHEQYCDTGGAKGQVIKLSEIDFRPMRTLKRRRLSGLTAPRSV